jgi:DNA-binding NarL/FixJ family response regulator
VGVGLINAGLGLDVAKTKTDLVAELTAYLAKLGLGDAHLARVISLLQATHGERVNLPAESEDSPPRSRRRRDASESPPPAWPTPSAPSKTVNLLVAEEQQILKEAYRAFFTTHPSINLVGCSSDTSAEALLAAATSAGPSVMLVGVKSLHTTTVEKLEILQENFPQVGVVLLFAVHDAGGIKALREFSRGSSAGRAYLVKHNLDTPEQLAQVVFSVAEGRVIVDPVIMGELIDDNGRAGSPLFDLSRKELEVLSWMARGYGDDTIASVLCRDVKTVERQVADIYSKLSLESVRGDHRVSAALSYLKATGLLSGG